MRRWNGARGLAARWPRACAVSILAVARLSLLVHRLPGVPGLSVGHSAPGDRFSGHLFRALATAAKALALTASLPCRALAPALAPVSAHARFRLRQAAQRRPVLARSDRAH